MNERVIFLVPLFFVGALFGMATVITNNDIKPTYVLAYAANGNEYVLDFGLSESDCDRAQIANNGNPTTYCRVD